MKQVKWFIAWSCSIALLAGCTTSTKQTKQTAATSNQQQNKPEDQQAKQPDQNNPQSSEQKQNEPSTAANSQQSNNQQSTNQQGTTSTSSQGSSEPQQSNVQANQLKAQSNQQTASAAPSGSSQQAQPAPQNNVVTLSIRGDSGMFLDTTEVELQGNDTVFTVLSRTVKKKGIQMEYQGAGASIYVMGINNLYQKDRGPKSGWLYRVNGVYGNVSAGKASVNNGDKVEWVYTTTGENP